MTQPTNDWLGFSRETRKLDRYQRGPCLKLMIHLYDKAQAAGRHYNDTDHQLHTDVMAGKTPCPLQHNCANYRTAIQRGGTPLHLIPRQLAFADCQVPQQHGGQNDATKTMSLLRLQPNPNQT